MKIKQFRKILEFMKKVRNEMISIDKNFTAQQSTAQHSTAQH